MDAPFDDAFRAYSRAYRERDFGAIEPYVTPDVVVDWTRSIGPMRGLYRGVSEVRAMFERWAEAFAEMSYEATPLLRLGERVALEARFRGRGAASGIEAPSIGGGETWTFEGGRIAEVRLFQEVEEGLRWVRVERLRESRLYFVCEARPDGRDPRPLLDAALRGGTDIVQLRDKDLPDEGLVAAAAPFREAASEHGALFVLNDRPDLVAACGADGVHVGQEDLPVAEARALAGPGALVGLSTHTCDEVDATAAVRGEARPDQISVGPVWETPTKPGRPATGLELVRYAAERAADLPWFAIGGIDAATVVDVVTAGAERIVVVRAIRDADDPERAARDLRATVARLRDAEQPNGATLERARTTRA